MNQTNSVPRPFGIVFTNGRVAITKDLIFGLSVLSEDGWMPLSNLDHQEVKMVHRLVDYNPTFPWQAELNALLADSEHKI